MAELRAALVRGEVAGDHDLVAHVEHRPLTEVGGLGQLGRARTLADPVQHPGVLVGRAVADETDVERHALGREQAPRREHDLISVPHVAPLLDREPDVHGQVLEQHEVVHAPLLDGRELLEQAQATAGDEAELEQRLDREVLVAEVRQQLIARRSSGTTKGQVRSHRSRGRGKGSGIARLRFAERARELSSPSGRAVQYRRVRQGKLSQGVSSHGGASSPSRGLRAAVYVPFSFPRSQPVASARRLSAPATAASNPPFP
jgi:hypothetical protein